MLPANQRKKINTRLGREVIKQSRERISKQRTIDSGQFSPRANGRKKKLLRKMMTGKKVKVWAGPNGAKVGWQNSLTGKIARAQQDGYTESFNAGKVARQESKNEDPDANATKAQAKKLVELGYTRSVGTYKTGAKKGKARKKRVSQRWIMDNLNTGYAGILIRTIGNEDLKASWNVVVPARPFFGLSKSEIKNMGKQIIEDVMNDVKAR
ncbi:Probable phage protein [Oleispira antarctica RB-8]|uniref:Probable phage protein n=1 Tax=Oleispira antarctica RB-8 TaxID=698738 RepID=R4YPB8_OLEAN|nr:Probable phage protein [Oleispira antarctica RB-8]